MTDAGVIYASVISGIINESINQEIITSSYNDKLKVANAVLGDILDNRLFPGKLVFQWINKFRNKFYKLDSFNRKLSHAYEMINFYESNAVAHYGFINRSINDSVFYSKNNLITVNTGLHLFISEVESMVYCQDCSFETNAGFMSRFDVKGKELIHSNESMREYVMLLLKRVVLKE